MFSFKQANSVCVAALGVAGCSTLISTPSLLAGVSTEGLLVGDSMFRFDLEPPWPSRLIGKVLGRGLGERDFFLLLDGS